MPAQKLTQLPNTEKFLLCQMYAIKTKVEDDNVDAKVDANSNDEKLKV